MNYLVDANLMPELVRLIKMEAFYLRIQTITYKPKSVFKIKKERMFLAFVCHFVQMMLCLNAQFKELPARHLILKRYIEHKLYQYTTMKMKSIDTKQIYNNPSFPPKVASSNNITTVTYYFPIQ
jgi:hypothetical protein